MGIECVGTVADIIWRSRNACGCETHIDRHVTGKHAQHNGIAEPPNISPSGIGPAQYSSRSGPAFAAKSQCVWLSADALATSDGSLQSTCASLKIAKTLDP